MKERKETHMYYDLRELKLIYDICDEIFCDEDCSPDWCRDLLDDSEYIDWTDSGACRYVGAFGDLSWVIKFDKYEEDTYCADECEYYARALEKGLERYFVPVFYVGCFGGVDIYAQPKGYGAEDTVSSEFYDYAAESYPFEEYKRYFTDGEDEDVLREGYESRISDDANRLENDERLSCLFGYDKETYNLIDFCEMYDINDLHAGNYVEVGGTIRIVDYAGY